MTITSEDFQAYLQCETKAYLKSTRTTGSERVYTDWNQKRLNVYREQCFHLLRSQCRDNEYLSVTAFLDIPPHSQHRFLLECLVQGQQLQSCLHAVERLAPSERGHTPSFCPIRFVPSEKITQEDKLLLAFDALALAQVTSKAPGFGKIIHGSQHKCVRVLLTTWMQTARDIAERMASQQVSGVLPTLILNRHCGECEFQARCRQIAIEKDDLSLLSNLTEVERKQHHSKGIFTVTQLSYTFRPRKRPKKFADKKEKHHPALQALAIREQKIHIVGKPELKMIGTPVYIDVEGTPEKDFYYLIGMRVKVGDVYVDRSFWADAMSEEETIWKAFLHVLEQVENPQLIHYGSYDLTFLKHMSERYGGLTASAHGLDKLVVNAVNVLSVIYAQIYFPTYSNGLKNIARYLGFEWTDSTASGLNSLVWRDNWENTQHTDWRERLIKYNLEDVQALQIVAEKITTLIGQQPDGKHVADSSVVNTEAMKFATTHRFGKNEFVLPEMELANKAAYWDYQREKVYVRSNERLKRIARRSPQSSATKLPVNKVIVCSLPLCCPQCGNDKYYKPNRRSKIVYDLKFSRSGVKRWIVKYVFTDCLCPKCRTLFYSPQKSWTRNKYGFQLLAYIVYQLVELRLHLHSISDHLQHLFGYNLNSGSLIRQRKRACEIYMATYERILDKIRQGKLVHADETCVSLKEHEAYVWVFTNLEEVAYVYAPTREGTTLETHLNGFSGVLVSDFYAAYDAMDCVQQKCLVHLIRDINDDLLNEPFNTELKEIAQAFSSVLKSIIETIDRHGLKAYWLKKHKGRAEQFFKNIASTEYKTERAIKYKQRFEKNCKKLFTFLNYDGVPWNNNNAEHAIKAFAAMRQTIGSASTEQGIREYLLLLSIRETCKYKGIRFLDFLLSEHQDIDEFSSKGRRSLQSFNVEPEAKVE